MVSYKQACIAMETLYRSFRVYSYLGNGVRFTTSILVVWHWGRNFFSLMPRYEYTRGTFLFTQNTHLKILIKNIHGFHDVTLRISKIDQKQKE